MKKRLLSLLLILVLVFTSICGCNSKNPTNESHENSETTTSQTNKKPTKPPYIVTLDNENASKEFDDFLDSLFTEVMSTSSININLRLSNPENYGILENPCILDSFTADFYKYGKDDNKLVLKELKAFDRSSLSANQRVTYDILVDSIENDNFFYDYYLFYEPLTPLSGLHSELPILFAEFKFRSREDIDTCLKLLSDTPRLFNEILEFERLKSEKGYFMNEDALNEVSSQLVSVYAPGDKFYLIDIMKNKIMTTDLLTDTEKADYVNRFTTAIKNDFMKAYAELDNWLIGLKNTSADGSFANKEGYKEYYSYLLKSYTGSDKTPLEIKKAAELALLNDFSQIYALSLTTDIESLLTDFVLPYSDNPSKALEYLIGAIEEDFPEVKSLSYILKDVDPALSDSLSPAFYLLPPIDDIDDNIIYINKNKLSDANPLYPILAHEGFPGHLYQTTYFNSLNPHPLRAVLSNSGYAEGWATYVENMSYELATKCPESPLDPTLAKLLSLDSTSTFALYTIADICINYEGYSLDETKTFFANYGILDESTVIEIYFTLLSNPGVYLQYYVGYLEILELRSECEKAWGENYSLKNFHEFLLSFGPAPFYIIDDYIDTCYK